MFDFRALFDAWRGQGLISEMFRQFQAMLADAEAMLEISCSAAVGTLGDAAEARERQRALDKQVNRAQRTIRRQVVEHLTVKRGIDVPASVILMSIVKDAERLGDYARNIFEAVGHSPYATAEPAYAPVIREICADVARLLSDTRKALTDSDEGLARDIMAREDAIKDKIDAMIEDLAKDKLPSDKTVTLALAAWYFRRLTAHTANIASSVTNPVERLDYKPRAEK